MKKQTTQEAIELVKNSFPTVWSQQDVIKLLESINVENNSDKINDVLDTIKTDVESFITNIDTADYIDFDSASFELDYGNTIALTEVELKLDKLASRINDLITIK